MSTGIQRISPTTELILPPQFTHREMMDIADSVAKSGLYGLKPDAALVLMYLAQAEGLHPVKALQRYHIFNGKPSMRSDAMLAEFQASGGRIEWTIDTDDACEAIFYHEKHCPKGKAISFTMADARRAGLANKDVWKSHPRPMLRARVITTGVRMIAPGVIMGIYTPDEIEEFTPRPALAESTARTSLTARLKEREAPTRPTNGHHPEPEAPANGHDVAEVVGAMKAHEEAQKPPAEPKTDCRLWIEGTLESFNAELHKAFPAVKAIHANQVINHVIKTAVEAELVNELLITNAAGKPDSRAKGREFSRLWDMDQMYVMKEVGQYLSSQLPEAASDDGDDIPDHISDDFPKKAG